MKSPVGNFQIDRGHPRFDIFNRDTEMKDCKKFHWQLKSTFIVVCLIDMKSAEQDLLFIIYFIYDQSTCATFAAPLAETNSNQGKQETFPQNNDTF